MSNRINWVDYAKGIGIILVVYGHVLIGVHDANLGMSEKLFLIQHDIIYGFHMPLFFFLSGLFVEKWKDRKFSIGFTQKLKTLIYPYLIWSLLQGGIMVILSSYINTNIKLKDLILVPFYPLDAQFWFVYDLFFIFIIYYLARKIFSLNITFLISIVIFLISPFLHTWELWRISFHLVFFVGGALLINKGKNLLKNINLMQLLAITVLFVIVNYIYLSLKNGYISHLLNLLAAIIGISLIVVLAMYIEKFNVNKILKYLGENSMVIYLVHIFAASGIRVILSKILGINNVVLHLVIGTIFGITVPLIAYFITKKLRLNGLLFGEFNKKTRTIKKKVA